MHTCRIILVKDKEDMENLKNRRLFLCIAILLTIVAIYPVKSADIQLSIQYKKILTDNQKICQLLWDTSNGFDEINSISKEIKNNQVTFNIPSRLYNEVKAYRIDFIDEPQDIEITRIQVKKNNLPVFTILPDRFKDYVNEYVGIEYCDTTQNSIHLNCVSEDSQIIFNEKFLNIINRALIQQDTIKGLAILGILGVYLLLRVPGPIRRKVGKIISEVNYKIKNNRKYAIRFLFEIMFIIIVMIVPLPSSHMKLNIYYDKVGEGESAQLLWKDADKVTFNTEDIESDKIRNNTAKIKINKKLAGEEKIYRIDFVSSVQNISIKKIEIEKYGICKKVINVDNFEEYVKEYVGISECSLRGDNIELNCAEEDSQVIFNQNFTQLINKNFQDWKIYRILVLLVSIIIFLLAETNNKLRKKIKTLYKVICQDFEEDHKRVFLYFIVILILLIIVLYWSFLIGDKYYIFKDVGSDSYNQTYPSLINNANRISMGKFGKTWDFTASIGDAQEIIFPKLENWVSFFGKDMVAYLLGISQMLKVFLAGVFFWGYLKVFGNSKGTASIFALGYAFCAHILIRGSWIAYPNETVLFALWLFCFELFYQKKDRRWLPLATTIFLLNFSGYYTVLYAGIFCAYAFLRYHSNYKEQVEEKKVGLKFGARFLGSIFLGYGMASMIIIPNVINMLKSDRFSNSVEQVGSETFFIKLKILKTAFFRTIGTDIVGINQEFKGYSNLLEGPAFYCGLFALVMIPVIWKVFKGRKCIWYTLGYLCILAYIVVNPIKNIANGFTGSYVFKLSSLWLIALLLMTTADAFENLKEVSLKNKIYFVSVGVAVVLCLVFHDMIVYNQYAVVSCLVMLIYSLMLFAWQRNKISFGKLKILLFIIVAAETFWMSHRIINDRVVVKSIEDMEYEDGTQEAVQYLAQRDDSFYRIDKQYYSGSYCDSLYQNYYGAVAYKGATGERNLTARFYTELYLPLAYNKHVSLGFQGDTGINTLMNMKYILSNNSMIQNFGYKYIDIVAGKKIYENQYALPLAVVYDTFLSKDDFEKMNLLERRQIFYLGAVLEGDDIEKYEIEAKKDSDIETIDLEKYEIRYKRQREGIGVRLKFPQISSDEVVVVKASISAERMDSEKGEDIFNCTYSDGTETGSVTYGVQEGKEDYFFEFNGEGIHTVFIGANEKMKVESIKIYILSQAEYYKNYIQKTQEWQKEGLQNVKYQDNTITGNIVTDKKKLLVFSVPYDKAFKLYVDGKEQETFIANIGFIGTWLEKGEHQVELNYEPEYSYVNITIIAIIIYVIYLIYYSLRGRKKRDEKDIYNSTSI